MKALVIGLGSMGRRRIRCLQSHGVASICGFDSRPDRRDAAAHEYGVETREGIAAADFAGFDVVVISTPPDQHHGYMGWAIDAGRACFVEASVIGQPLPALLARARHHNVLVAPSCTLRFHPAIRDIKEVVTSGRYGKVSNFSYHCGQYLPDWHPWEKVSEYYVSNPATGGAREIVPFELTWLVDVLGWPVKATGLKLKTMDVGADIDDTYVAMLQFQRFAGSMVVDVVARKAVRRLTLNLEQASLSWDWDEGTVRIYEAANERTIELRQPEAGAHAGYHQNIGEAMYIAEIGSFLAAAAGNGMFPHSLEDDIRVLDLLKSIENAGTS